MFYFESICSIFQYFEILYVFINVIKMQSCFILGRWCNGKLQGAGKMEWPDGKSYMGQFQNSQMCGVGRMESPGISTFEGQWKDGLQNGYGTIK